MFLQLKFFDNFFAEASHHDQIEFRFRKTRKKFAPVFDLGLDVIFHFFLVLSLKTIVQLSGIHIIEVGDKLVFAVFPTLFFITDLK